MLKFIDLKYISSKRYEFFHVNEDLILLEMFNYEPIYNRSVPCIMEISEFENEYKNCYFYYQKSKRNFVEKMEKLSGEVINSTFIIDKKEIDKDKIEKVSWQCIKKKK